MAWLTSLKDALKNPAEARELVLVHKKLTKLSPEVGALTALVRLDVGSNKLTSLPAELGAMTHLRSLSVHNNELRAFPEQILALVQLEELNLGANKIARVPDEVRALTKLRKLDVTFCYLPARELEKLAKLLPSCAITGAATQLAGAQRDDEVSAKIADDETDHHSMASAVASGARARSLITTSLAGASLGKLPNLERLTAAGAKLTAVPPELGTLKKLRSLGLAHNRLKALPRELELLARTLRSLDLADNRFEQVPPEVLALTALEELNLAGNKLKKLPDGMARLRKLKLVDLSRNPLPEKEVDRIEKLLPGNCDLFYGDE